MYGLSILILEILTLTMFNYVPKTWKVEKLSQQLSTDWHDIVLGLTFRRPNRWSARMVLDHLKTAKSIPQRDRDYIVHWLDKLDNIDAQVPISKDIAAKDATVEGIKIIDIIEDSNIISDYISSEENNRLTKFITKLCRQDDIANEVGYMKAWLSWVKRDDLSYVITFDHVVTSIYMWNCVYQRKWRKASLGLIDVFRYIYQNKRKKDCNHVADATDMKQTFNNVVTELLNDNGFCSLMIPLNLNRKESVTLVST